MVAISAHTKNWLDTYHSVQYWDLSVKTESGCDWWTRTAYTATLVNTLKQTGKVAGGLC